MSDQMRWSPFKTFCTLPWMHLFADEMGKLFPCCFSHQEAICDEKGKPFHFSNPDALKQAWNSEFMRDIRRKMLNGERPRQCISCYRTEDLGGESYRQSQSLLYGHQQAEFSASTEPDGTAPMNVQFIDIRLGNKCNLKCRMCSPHSSRLLIEEFSEISGLNENDPWFESLRNVDWYKKPEAWKQLELLLPYLQRIHFAGGEPLIIKEGIDFLKKIVDLGQAKNIEITYNSNITVIPKELLTLWPHFRAVSICASLDGYGKVNDYIRHPSKWDVIHRNLQFLEKSGKDVGVIGISIHATIQIYNALGITDLFRYLFENYNYVSPYAYMDLVMDRDALDAQILPLHLRQLAVERIDRFLEYYDAGPGKSSNPQAPLFRNRVLSIRNYLMEADQSHRLPEFRRVTEIYDRRRGQSLGEVIPELADISYSAKPAQGVGSQVAEGLSSL